MKSAEPAKGQRAGNGRRQGDKRPARNDGRAQRLAFAGTVQFLTIPNLLSLARLLVFLPILWVLAILGQVELLGGILVLALLTDALDGFLARRLNQVTVLGAKLDSIADNTLILSAIFWLIMLRPEVVHGRFGVILLLSVLLWLAVIAISWVRFRRFANLHLYSDKVAAVIGGVCLVISFLFGFKPLLFYLATGVAALANLEGMALVLMRNQVDEHVGSIFRTVNAS